MSWHMSKKIGGRSLERKADPRQGAPISYLLLRSTEPADT